METGHAKVGMTGREEGRAAAHPSLADGSPRTFVSWSPGLLVSWSRSLRAWCYLVWLSFRRQARVRQMVGIALALLVVAVGWIAVQSTLRGGFGMQHWRTPRRAPLTYGQWAGELELRLSAAPLAPGANAVQQGILGACQAVIARSDVLHFSQVIFALFISFLLPIWSLSFATDALGGEREGGNLIWLLTRPLPRSAIYLAKFVALLPWSLALNVGGFGLMCLAAGRPGPVAFALYWPAVLWSTLAFTALFHLMGASFPRPAIVALVYAFFLEMILGNMPGYMKRVSIGFYARCMMFDAAQEYGVQPEKPSVYLPVDGATAYWVLIGLTAGLLALGMYLFARKEYQDLT
ncbi:MAG TPA: ABC transporter permease [Gemmataceae bacterium]|nr:ABC transporter permease [Gemmataceae bacterium]